MDYTSYPRRQRRCTAVICQDFQGYYLGYVKTLADSQEQVQRASRYFGDYAGAARLLRTWEQER